MGLIWLQFATLVISVLPTLSAHDTNNANKIERSSVPAGAFQKRTIKRCYRKVRKVKKTNDNTYQVSEPSSVVPPPAPAPTPNTESPIDVPTITSETFSEPTPNEPVYKPEPTPNEPVYEPKPTSKKPVYKPKPTSKSVSKPTPTSKEPAYEVKPTSEAPSYPVKPNKPKYDSDTKGLDMQRMLDSVNAERAKKGAKPLTLNNKLSNIAKGHSQWQADNKKMNHEGDGGSKPCNRCALGGYMPNSCGENIADGQTTTDQVMKDWIASPGHYENIINPDYVEVGFAMVDDYWTQLFGMGEKPFKDGSMVVCKSVGGKYDIKPPPTPNTPKYDTKPAPSKPKYDTKPAPSKPKYGLTNLIPKFNLNFNAGINLGSKSSGGNLKPNKPKY